MKDTISALELVSNLVDSMKDKIKNAGNLKKTDDIAQMMLRNGLFKWNGVQIREPAYEIDLTEGGEIELELGTGQPFSAKVMAMDLDFEGGDMTPEKIREEITSKLKDKITKDLISDFNLGKITKKELEEKLALVEDLGNNSQLTEGIERATAKANITSHPQLPTDMNEDQAIEFLREHLSAEGDRPSEAQLKSLAREFMGKTTKELESKALEAIGGMTDIVAELAKKQDTFASFLDRRAGGKSVNKAN